MSPLSHICCFSRTGVFILGWYVLLKKFAYATLANSPHSKLCFILKRGVRAVIFLFFLFFSSLPLILHTRHMLYIDLRLRQTYHSIDGGSAYSIDVGELGWQYGTVTNWCTGREWPVNCMRVISARWRSNMPFLRRWKYISRWLVVGEIEWALNYYITRWRQEVSLFGHQTRWWQDAVEKASRVGLQAAGWAAQENGKETRLWPK